MRSTRHYLQRERQPHLVGPMATPPPQGSPACYPSGQALGSAAPQSPREPALCTPSQLSHSSASNVASPSACSWCQLSEPLLPPHPPRLPRPVNSASCSLSPAPRSLIYSLSDSSRAHTDFLFPFQMNCLAHLFSFGPKSDVVFPSSGCCDHNSVPRTCTLRNRVLVRGSWL